MLELDLNTLIVEAQLTFWWEKILNLSLNFFTEPYNLWVNLM